MAELHVDTKSIKDLLTNMQGKCFVIPEYQRPYNWDEEKCSILWDDILEFYLHEKQTDKDEYFLGAVVNYFLEKDDNPQIIDGQQRITTIFLMIRAIYKKLEEMEENSEVRGLKTTLEPFLWDIDEITRAIEDKNKTHLRSEVATDEDNEILSQILSTGVIIEHDSNYAKNYAFFYKKWGELAQEQALHWKKLLITFLKNVIFLPISCNSEESALRIFSTLNDRGLPLTDADIFKSEIYKSKKSKEEKQQFIDEWKDLTTTTSHSDLSIEDVFRYYTHILRAREKNVEREIGLRKFFRGNDNFKIIKDDNLINDVKYIAKFWDYVNNRIESNDDFSFDTKTRNYLHLLMYYPNDFWKFPLTVYIFKNRENENLNNELNKFVEFLISFLFVKFMQYPSVNAIKTPVYKLCKQIYHDEKIDLGLKIDEINEVMEIFDKYSTSRIAKPILILNSYLYSHDSIIENSFNIEHILPKKWQDTYYNGLDKEEAIQYIEMFGNKIIFEQKLNIQAGNDYFSHKKDKYSKSKINEVKDLSNYSQNDWSKEDIIKRNNEMKQRLTEFFVSSISYMES